MAKIIMVQGTGSSVGKSILVTALCRIFLQDGFRPCPFKAQNMSLNSFVTKKGGEMGRAQVTQAQACRIDPDADMNPVLIKPTADTKAQIILQGKPAGNMNVSQYKNFKKIAFPKVAESFRRLNKEYEVIVMEGAGSPAEINLRDQDIVNMRMAKFANAPVLLAGDIDKGGVFASLVGTLELLMPSERARIKGFIINKFRGDKKLLQSGIDFLERKTKIPVLGVIPYLKTMKIPEEDSVALENMARKQKMSGGMINISIIKLPYMSNFTDFDALENEPDVNLSYVSDNKEFGSADMIIIPGTKNTISDLRWLKKSGLAQKIINIVKSDKSLPILIGICGGYQMLGNYVYDPAGLESGQKKGIGLGLLPITTTLKPEKMLLQTAGVEIKTGIKVRGYQIHHGKTVFTGKCRPFFKTKIAGGGYDGASLKNGKVCGTYLHGVFDSEPFRRNLLNKIRLQKRLKNLPISKKAFNFDAEIDKLAGIVRKNLDIKLVYKILNNGI